MVYITVARTIVNFNNENETLQYISDALYYIKNNYKDKYSYTFKSQEFNSNIELIELLANIINKMKDKTSIVKESLRVLDNEKIL